MKNENYKKRAIDVRQNARANLRAIRQARLARRAEISASPIFDVIERETPDNASTTVKGALTAGIEDGQLAQVDATSPSSGVGSESVAKFDNYRDGINDALNELALKNAADGFEQPDNEALDDAQSHASKPDEASQDAKWSDCELARLPGAGPGLVWMLAQCHVTTLKELALRRPDELSAQLGVVGQIVDVAQWIEFAESEAHLPSAQAP